MVGPSLGGSSSPTLLPPLQPVPVGPAASAGAPTADGVKAEPGMPRAMTAANQFSNPSTFQSESVRDQIAMRCASHISMVRRDARLVALVWDLAGGWKVWLHAFQFCQPRS